MTNTEELTVANQESQLYEEIGDMNTPTSTGNTGVSSSAPGTGTAAARSQYEYEDVKPVAKPNDPYDIHCVQHMVCHCIRTENDCVNTLVYINTKGIVVCISSCVVYHHETSIRKHALFILWEFKFACMQNVYRCIQNQNCCGLVRKFSQSKLL